MYDFEICTELPPMLISSPQGLGQNLSFELAPIDNAVLHFPRDYIDCRVLCDECKRLVLPIFSHNLVSIL